jgi:Zn-dependent protease
MLVLNLGRDIDAQVIESSISGYNNQPFIPNLYSLSLIIGAVNLIPIPPLDGGHVMKHILPQKIRKSVLIFLGIGGVALLLLEMKGMFHMIEYLLS